MQPDPNSLQILNWTNLLSQIQWRDIIGGAGIIFGVITAIAYWDQRKAHKEQKELLKFVDRHLDKEISEETLEGLKSQMTVMEKQVEQEIPSLARLAVLKEQAEMHAQAISHHYREWQRIITETQSTQSSDKIDDNIRQVIIDKILPSYERQWELDDARNRITALSVLIALSSSLLFSPINILVAVVLAYPLTSNLMTFLRLQQISNEFVVSIKKGVQAAYVLLCLAAGVIGTAFIFDSHSIEDKYVGCIFILIGATALAFIPVINKVVTKKLNEKLGI